MLYWCKDHKVTRCSNKIPFSIYLGHSGRSYLSDRYSFCRKRPLAIVAISAELPPFKNGQQNSESSSTNDLDLTPSMSSWGLRLVVIGHVQLSLLITAPTGALANIGRLIIFLVLLIVGWKVSTCVRITPVKSFLYQTTHSNAPYMSIIGWGALGFNLSENLGSLRHRIGLRNRLYLGVVTPPVQVRTLHV